MKKAKNKKIVDFWNKIKKPLMILSVVGNILFLIFIIVGCVGVKTKTQEVKAEDSPIIYNLEGTSWRFNETLTSYSPQGKNMKAIYTASTGFIESYNVRFGLSTYDNGTFASMQFRTALRLNMLQGYQYNSSGGQTLISVYNYSTDLWDNGIVPIITFGEYEPNTQYTDEGLIAWLYENATLLDSFQNLTFTFSKNFNYNAPFKTYGDSPFVTDIQEGGQKTYNLPYFVSNNQLFNAIRLTYIDAQNTRYYDYVANVIKINNAESTAYYSYMEYLNTNTDEVVLVNTRNYGYYTDSSNNTQVYLDRGSIWTNNEYQVLLFQDISATDKDKLTQFNNYDVVNGFDYSSTNSGIGNVFVLLGSAFGGLRNIFAIEVLPNITIGLLIFLPLIVGLIITIIWLVKR